ncbi:unnamed protein product [Caenorhabditis auriculariae]|uniref:PDZ domain-containing protein n=1 Tax=Caenorhabditis auriculariae TaxID=2777116 RepID=A0A8S1H9U9_9PELO|nr:unnamed protein product [Caenorhabditis auriculariae]
MLKGKVVLVTGASRGVGRGVAVEVAKRGATVFITGRRPSNESSCQLQNTAEEITASCGTAIVKYVDHSNMEQVEGLFEDIKLEAGRLDVLVNNAYSGVPIISANLGRKFHESDPEDLWDGINNVGLRNVYFCSVYAARIMAAQGSGLIINLSSVGGLYKVFNVPYGVGKAAVDRMSKDCALELRDSNVAVISLWPGAVQTETFMTLAKGEEQRLGELNHLFLNGESTTFVGRAVASLAEDDNLTSPCNTKFRDVGDRKPPHFRSIKQLLSLSGYRGLSKIVPEFFRLPGWMLTALESTIKIDFLFIFTKFDMDQVVKPTVVPDPFNIEEIAKYQPREFIEHFLLTKPIGVRVLKQDCRITNIQANSGLTGKAFVGDTIVAVDGVRISKGEDLYKKLKEPSEKVMLEIRHCSWSWCYHIKTTVERIQMDRDTEKISGKPVDLYYVVIKIASPPEVPPPPIGLYVKYDNRDRLQIASVEPRSMSAIHLRAGDIIRECNGRQLSSKAMLEQLIIESIRDKGSFSFSVEAPTGGESVRDSVEMAPDVVEIANKQIEEFKKAAGLIKLKSCLETQKEQQKRKFSISSKERTEFSIVSDCDPSKLRPCKNAN